MNYSSNSNFSLQTRRTYPVYAFLITFYAFLSVSDDSVMRPNPYGPGQAHMGRAHMGSGPYGLRPIWAGPGPGPSLWTADLKKSALWEILHVI